MSFLTVVPLVPFTGVLVRYRVQYHPKPQIQLETPTAAASTEAGNATPSATSNSSGNAELSPLTFLQITKKLYRIQGVEGMSKGLMPTLIYTFVSSLVRHIRFQIYMSPSPATPPSISWGGPPFGIIVYCSYLFALVVTYRAIMVRKRLDTFRPQEAWHAVLTAYERKKLWTLYISPLSVVLIFNILYNTVILQPLKDLLWAAHLKPETRGPGSGFNYEPILYEMSVLLLALASTIILAPLENIATRLALQRNYGPEITAQESEPRTIQDIDTVDIEKGDITQSREAQDLEDSIVQLRVGKERYTTPLDFLQKVLAEEGWRVLYRGWIFTFLGVFFS